MTSATVKMIPLASRVCQSHCNTSTFVGRSLAGGNTADRSAYSTYLGCCVVKRLHLHIVHKLKKRGLPSDLTVDGKDCTILCLPALVANLQLLHERSESPTTQSRSQYPGPAIKITIGTLDETSSCGLLRGGGRGSCHRSALRNVASGTQIKNGFLAEQGLEVTVPLSSPDTIPFVCESQLQLKRRNNRFPEVLAFDQTAFPATNDDPAIDLGEVCDLGSVDLTDNESVVLLSGAGDEVLNMRQSFHVVLDGKSVDQDTEDRDSAKVDVDGSHARERVVAKNSGILVYSSRDSTVRQQGRRVVDDGCGEDVGVAEILEGGL
ncbi:putative diphthamide biosynthesis protein Dph2, partial [Aureobasidium melanogenum]